MRVLHINSGNLYGGVETLLSTLARLRHLCPDMEPVFAVCYEGRSFQEIEQSGAPVRLLGPARVSRPWTVWRARRAFANLLREWAPDVAVCHGAWNHAMFAPVARRLGVPLVFWAHGPALGRHWLDRWANLTRPDLVIANSRWTRDNFRLFAGPPTEVLHYPVADASSANRTRDRHDIRREFGTPADKVVIVQVSRLEAWKGHAFLFDVLARLSSNGDWECWIVGGAQRPEEERYRAALQAQAARDGIADRVRFVGQRRDVPRILAGGDIHCQPNLGPEPFGITFIEALYAALPVVTVAHGGALEIVTDECGVLIARGDGAALTEALRRLISQPELRRRLGEGGPARARAACEPKDALDRLAAVLTAIAKPTAAAVSSRALAEVNVYDVG